MSRARLLPATAAMALALLVAGCRSSAPLVTAPTPTATPAPVAAAPLPAPPPTPSATPAAAPTATPLPAPLPAAPTIRVLLSGPLPQSLGLAGERYRCSSAGTAAELVAPLRVTLGQGPPAVQIGAFARGAPEDVLVRLKASGFDVITEPSPAGPTRVIAIGLANESPAGLADRLRRAGFAEQKPAPSPRAAGVAVQGADGVTVVGAAVEVVPLGPQSIRVGERPYRGSLVLRPGVDGVRLVNVLPVEEYLRGVVPSEMGPRAFPFLEALKAQAVAARTYAAARLGEHEADGYDLCDTVQCQVYGGASVEHPLSDQAVRETSGELLLWAGKPIQAYYHSTCAGHTEDGDVQFPGASGPYLKGVPCRGELRLALGAGKPVGPWLGQIERLALVAGELARALGVAATPAALRERLVERDAGTASAPGQAEPAILAEAARLAGEPSLAAGESLQRLLEGHKLGLPPPGGHRAESYELALTLRLGQLLGEVVTTTGRLLPVAESAGVVGDGGEPPRLADIGATVVERRADRWRRGPVTALPGSTATMWCVGDRCPVLEVEPLASADATSSWSWWSRELSLAEVARKLDLRAVTGVTVLDRGKSGRVTRVRVATPDGGVDMAGLAFRYALGLPDSMFSVVTRHRGGGAAVRFLGRGWGHGVGMCQNGAFGLARGGAGYREILATYYSGVQLGSWGDVSRVAAVPGAHQAVQQ